VKSAMSTIQKLWPNLKELMVTLPQKHFVIPLPSQMPLSQLEIEGRVRHTAVLHNADSLLCNRTLVKLDVLHCQGFAEVVLVE